MTFTINISLAKGEKCARCRRYTQESDYHWNEICERCHEQVIGYFSLPHFLSRKISARKFFSLALPYWAVMTKYKIRFAVYAMRRGLRAQ